MIKILIIGLLLGAGAAAFLCWVASQAEIIP